MSTLINMCEDTMNREMLDSIQEHPEWKKNNESLQKKYEEALKYLGDKWILKGGVYNRSNLTLGKK